MNKRIKLLALLMSLVMVLGIMVVIPMTASAYVACDTRVLAETLQAKDINGQHSARYGEWAAITLSENISVAPEQNGTIGETEYQSDRATAVYTNGATVSKTGAHEYYAQDADNIYLAFVLPGYTSGTDVTLKMWGNSTYDINSSSVDYVSTGWGTTKSDCLTLNIASDGSVSASSTSSVTPGLAGAVVAERVDWSNVSAVVSAAEGAATVEIQLSKKDIRDVFAQYLSTDVPSLRYTLKYSAGFVGICVSRDVPGGSVRSDLATYIMNSAAQSSNPNGAVFAKTINYTATTEAMPAINDVRLDLAPWGIEDADLYLSETSPVVDGTIGAEEYGFSRLSSTFLRNNGKYNSGLNVTEHLAQDEDYVYFAFEAPQYDSTKNTYLVLYTRDLGNTAGSVYTGATLSVTENGLTSVSNVVPTSATYTANNDVWATYGYNGTDPDTCKVTMSGTTGIIEMKVSKQALAESGYQTVDAFANFRYAFVYYRTSDKATGDGVWCAVRRIGSTLVNGLGYEAMGKNVNLYGKVTTPIEDIRTDLEAYGYESRNLNELSSAVVDGVVDSKDVYSLTVSNPANSKTSALPYDVKEYFAYDANRYYYAITVPESVGNMYYLFWTTNSGIAGANDDNRLFIYMNADGTYSYGGERGQNDAYARHNTAGIKIENVEYATKNNGDGTRTLEISILRYELDNSSKKTDGVLNNIRYAVEDAGQNGKRLTYMLSGPAKLSIVNNNDPKFRTRLGINVNFDYDASDVRNLDSCGYESRNLEELSDACVDGVIDAKDNYSLSVNNLNGYSTNASGYDVTEYFAYDEDNFYYAVVLDASVSKFYYYLYASDSGNAKASWELRSQILLNSDGTFALEGYRGANASNSYCPANEEAIKNAKIGFATKDNGDGTRTWELRISRNDLDIVMSAGKILSNLRYGLNIDSKYVGYKLTDGVKASIKADNASNFDQGYLGINVNFGNTVVDIGTADKGSVRMDTIETSGLRFKTTVSKAYLAELEAQGYTISAGTLIAPEDYVGDEFAELAFDVEGMVVGENCLNVVADLTQAYFDGYATITFTGSIVNIKNKNLARNFSARGYLAITKDGVTEYIYSDVVASRNVKTVAQAALDAGDHKGNETYKAILETLAGVQA